MHDYKVSFAEVPHTRSDNEKYSGVLIHIRPPLLLNPDAVEQFLTFGDLEPLDPVDQKAAEGLDVKNAVLLGSTAVQTTINASIDKKFSESLAQQVANDTVRLLKFMGGQAIIDNPSVSDA